MEDTAAVGDGGASPTTFSADEKSVRILKGVRAGQSVRPVGSDIVEGVTVLKAGEIIRAAEVRGEKALLFRKMAFLRAGNRMNIYISIIHIYYVARYQAIRVFFLLPLPPPVLSAWILHRLNVTE